MNVFAMHQLVPLFRRIKEGRCECQRWKGAQDGGHIPSENDQHSLRALFSDTAAFADVAGFSATHSKAAQIAQFHGVQAQKGIHDDVSTFDSDLRNLEDTVVSDIERHVFLLVHPSRKAFVDNPAMFGDRVERAFPSAAYDIREAGNCLAADCNTAAVFHLMRVVECGLRAFAKHLRITKIPSRSRGRRLLDVTYAQWEQVLRALQAAIDAKIQKLRPGPRKQDFVEFYPSALSDIRAIKDVWRNHCMHARSNYSPEQAQFIMSHVRSLMVRLAERVAEVQ